MIKFELEIPIHASPTLLYGKLASASGLEEWFADKANLSGKTITFSWDGADEEAKIITKKLNKLIKFKWLESEEDETYFQFEIVVDDLTNDVSIVITDFAEDEDSAEEAKQLWESQIDQLRGIVGG